AWSTNGGSDISRRAAGYSSSNAVSTRMPLRSRLAAERSASVSWGPRRTARATSRDLNSAASSSSAEAKRASTPPPAASTGQHRRGDSARLRDQDKAAHRETKPELTALTYSSCGGGIDNSGLLGPTGNL